MYNSRTRDPDEPTKVRGEGGNYFSGGGTGERKFHGGGDEGQKISRGGGSDGARLHYVSGDDDNG